jgi:hypothetical protein
VAQAVDAGGMTMVGDVQPCSKAKVDGLARSRPLLAHEPFFPHPQAARCRRRGGGRQAGCLAQTRSACLCRVLRRFGRLVACGSGLTDGYRVAERVRYAYFAEKRRPPSIQRPRDRLRYTRPPDQRGVQQQGTGPHSPLPASAGSSESPELPVVPPGRVPPLTSGSAGRHSRRR